MSRARDFGLWLPTVTFTLALSLTVVLLLKKTSAEEIAPAANEAASLTDVEIGAVRSIARSHPCAATVLLHVLRNSTQTQNGNLYFEGIPSARSVELMMDTRDGGAFTNPAPALPRNPYSSAEFFVEVRWTVVRMDEESVMLTTRAELVDRYGAPIRPVHLIEQSTNVLLSRTGIHLLERPLTL